MEKRRKTRTRGWSCTVTALVMITLLSTLACAGPQTVVRVPKCVESVEVTGEHRRISSNRFVFDHGMELPFTKTQITVERRDGTEQSFEVVNSVPDVVNMVGGAIVGAMGIGLVALHASQVSNGAEPPFGPSFWLVPVGGLALLGGTYLGLTGWHPSSDILVETPCSRGGG